MERTQGSSGGTLLQFPPQKPQFAPLPQSQKRQSRPKVTADFVDEDETRLGLRHLWTGIRGALWSNGSKSSLGNVSLCDSELKPKFKGTNNYLTILKGEKHDTQRLSEPHQSRDRILILKVQFYQVFAKQTPPAN